MAKTVSAFSGSNSSTETVTIVNDTTINGQLNVVGDITVSNLTVDGTLTVQQMELEYNNITVDGNATIGGTLGVTGATTLGIANITTANITNFALGTTATAGDVLTTNASGVGTWQPAPSGGTVSSTTPIITTHKIIFTSNSNWTVPNNITTIFVSGCGGGGGGSEYTGGAAATPFFGTINTTPGDVLSITIGAGGVGTAAQSITVNNGSNSTIVDSTTSTTLLTMTGAGGELKSYGLYTALPGQSGAFGVGGQGGGSATNTGGNATGYGAGGGYGNGATGGNGAPGIVIIEW